MTNNFLTTKRRKIYQVAGHYFINSKGEPMKITLKDRLSHLTYREACKLLGPEGERFIRQGGKYDFDIGEQVTWGDDIFRLNLGEATVTLSLQPENPKSLDFACSQCSESCEHAGAAFCLLLEEKLSLGLSAPPPEKQPVDMLR